MNGEWRYNQVALKASHNTYAIDAPLTTLTPSQGWSFPVYEAGCRAIELDIAQYGGREPGRFMQWSVQHDGDYRLHNRQFSQFLAELRAWSSSRPDHDVVTILICLKGVRDGAGFPAQLDAYIGQFLCGDDLACLYTPGDLLGGTYGDLRTAARQKGWPRLDAMRGRLLLVMTGDEDLLEVYAASAGQRLGFACVDCTNDKLPPAAYISGKPNQLFLNYHLYGDDREVWVPNLRAVVDDPSMLFRGYLVQDDWWDDAVAAGVNMLATDNVDHLWPEPFRLRS